MPVGSRVAETGFVGSAIRPERAVAYPCGSGAPNLEGNGEIELPANLTLPNAVARGELETMHGGP